MNDMEKRMNHDLIDTLVELYLQLPHQSPESAARRVAVLVEMTLSAMEAEGEVITREALLKRVKSAIEKHLSHAA